MTGEQAARWAKWVIPTVTGIIVGLAITHYNQKLYGAEKLWENINSKAEKEEMAKALEELDKNKLNKELFEQYVEARIIDNEKLYRELDQIHRRQEQTNIMLRELIKAMK